MKNIFTVHSKTQDYVFSKVVIGVFSSACMIATYLIGALASRMLSGLSFEVNVGGLILRLFSKILLSVGFSALFVMINVFFQKMLGFSIVGRLM